MHWIVNVAGPEPVTVFGVMDPVMPFGKALADNCIMPEKPLTAVIVSELVAVEPCTHVRLDTPAVILKLGVIPVVTVTGIVSPRDR